MWPSGLEVLDLLLQLLRAGALCCQPLPHLAHHPPGILDVPVCPSVPPEQPVRIAAARLLGERLFLEAPERLLGQPELHGRVDDLELLVRRPAPQLVGLAVGLGDVDLLDERGRVLGQHWMTGAVG